MKNLLYRLYIIHHRYIKYTGTYTLDTTSQLLCRIRLIIHNQ